MDPGSPLELQSQIASEDMNQDHDSDAENHDPLSTSPIGFATQLPLPDHGNPKEKTKAHVIHTDALLDQLATRNTTRDAQLLSNRSKIDTVKLSDGHEEPSSSFSLSQRPLMAPSSTSLSKATDISASNEIDQNNPKPEVIGDADASNEPAFPDSIPPAVLEVLRSWRQECHEGRHIPRRLQMISKDQAKILESEDSWQPALVGHPQRQGTVPITLLNKLCQIADQDESISLPPDHVNSMNIETDINVGGHARESQHEKQQKEEDNKLREDSIAPSEEESEHVDWTSSPPQPPRAYRQLPPDSPPTPMSARKNEMWQRDDIVTKNRSNPSLLCTSSNEAGHQPSSGLLVHTQNVDGVDKQLHDSEIGEKLVVMSPTSARRREVDHLSSSLDNARNSSASLQRTVQVKRTPFHVKEPLSTSSIFDSSTRLVPATFDEKTYRMRQNIGNHTDVLRNIGRRDDSEVDFDEGRTFEADSSEDDVVARRSQTLVDDSRMTSPTTIDRVDNRETSNISTNFANVKMQGTIHRHKRKRDLHSPNQNKRRKSDRSQQAQPYGNQQSSDYGQIDEERIQYRRKHLSKLRHKRGESEDKTLQHAASVREAGTVANHNSVQEETGSKRSYQPKEVQTVADLSMNEPTYQCLNPPNPTEKSSKSPSLSLVRPNPVEVDLFDMFKTAYPNYDGHRNHFVAACQLLRKLQLEGKATHQSLWDDFIYRHFHEYRQYLLEILENCGSALPYEQFYDKHVEQPTHLGRLVRPSKLADFLGYSEKPVSSFPLVKDIQKSDGPTKTHSVERSTGVDPANTHHSIVEQSLQAESLQRSFPKQTSHDSPASQKPRASMRTTPPEQSQGPSTSVRLWLERVAGAESPVLGTQVVSHQNNTDVPILDLDQGSSQFSTSKPTSTKQIKRRSLPWPSATEHHSPSVTMTVEKKHLPSARRQKEARNSSLPMVTVIKRRKSSQPSSSRQKHQSETPARETAFQRWNRLYRDLPAEKEAIEKYQAGSGHIIDITGWRG